MKIKGEKNSTLGAQDGKWWVVNGRGIRPAVDLDMMMGMKLFWISPEPLPYSYTLTVLGIARGCYGWWPSQSREEQQHFCVKFMDISSTKVPPLFW